MQLVYGQDSAKHLLFDYTQRIHQYKERSSAPQSPGMEWDVGYEREQKTAGHSEQRRCVVCGSNCQRLLMDSDAGSEAFDHTFISLLASSHRSSRCISRFLSHLLWWFRPCGGCAQKSTVTNKSPHIRFSPRNQYLDTSTLNPNNLKQAS